MASKRTTRRRAGKEECIINCLPRELIEHVFLGLPASCLLQCTSVCKKWCEIIRDSQFALAHLQHATSCTLLFSPQGSTKSGELYPSDVLLFDEAWSPSKSAVPVIGPDDLVCGTCNGLLCLHTPTSTIKIANLATGECLHLKKPTKSLKDDHFSFYRFGFHPVTKEYKIIHFSQESSSSTEGRFNVIQVYTLGDEKWKDVVTPEALSLNSVKNSGVVIVDGTMYWLTEDSVSDWQHAVMSFDLGEGSFEQIELPSVDFEDWEHADARHYWITEINGKVCVATSQSLNGILIWKLKIWALNRNVDKRWSHMYSIQLSSLFARRLNFIPGDKILIQDCDSNLHSYELLEKDFEIEFSKMVKMLDLSPRGEDDFQFHICVKSLVPLDSYAKAAVVHRPKRQGGWGLKKWKAWERDNVKLEKMWRKVNQLELRMLERMRHLGIRAKEISQRLPDEVIQQRVSMEIDRILQYLPDCPDQHPSPVRRLNWVEKMENMRKLNTNINELKDKMKVVDQAREDIVNILESCVDDYCQGKLKCSIENTSA